VCRPLFAKPGQLVSNLTHYSPANPEARIAYKTGKPRILAYLASVGVDVARQVITHIHADLADWRDSRYLLAIVAATRQRLQTFGLGLSRVVADTGYSSGEYDAASDSYTCKQGKLLTFHKVFVDSEGHAQCKGKKAKEKRLHHTPHKAHYDRILARLATRLGKRLLRLRAATVEPVLGSLIICYGLRQISKKGQAGAAKVLHLAVMAYNLKKYLRAAAPQQPASLAIALPIPSPFLGA
jgi:hypothetical protein